MGSPIATWSWGSGPDTLVFLHALLPAATGRSIEEVAIDLTTQVPLRVIGIDAPGFGLSTPRADSDYALGQLAALLGATAAQAGTPYVLAGHSWGAALAVRIAATRPHDVRGLVLLDGGHFDHAALPNADPGQTVAQTVAEMEGIGWRYVDHKPHCLGPGWPACCPLVTVAGSPPPHPERRAPR